MRSFSRLSLLWLLATCVAVPIAGADDIDESMAARNVEQLLSQEVSEDIAAIWRVADQLRKLGAPALPALREKATTAVAPHRLAIGRAMVQLQDYTQGLDALKTLISDAAAPDALRSAALSVLGLEGEPEDAEWLDERIDLELNPRVKLAMATALWDLNTTLKSKGRDVMQSFLKSTDPDLRALGALALGEIGDADSARSELNILKREPSERGRTARILLDLIRARNVIDELESRGEASLPEAVPPVSQPSKDPAPKGSADGSWPLLDEIWTRLEEAYAFPEKLDRKKIEDAAAVGITKALDENTVYMSPEVFAELEESLDPSYGGIGAYVMNDPNNGQRFTISRPIYGGPVYQADLRAGDVVVMVGDTPTAGLEVDECVKLLKGPPGTTVKMSVMRPGWTKAREYTLTRRRIVIPTSAYDILPGRVGFLQLHHFSEETAAEVGKVLDTFDKEHVRGIVLDLRANSGGYMKSAVQIASNFLPRGTVVVRETGREGVWPSRDHVSDGRGAHRRQVPIVVLIDQLTASAAEILAGALKDNGAARLVGLMTFGKGTAQIPLPLTQRPGEAYVDSLRDVQTYQDLNRNGQHDAGEPVGLRKSRNGRYDPPERFTDQDGDGRYDEGEPYVDANGNGTWDDGEPFTDSNANHKRDPGGKFKTTIAKYLTPSGFNPHGVIKVVDGRIRRVGGIEPDLEVNPREDYDFWEIHEQRQLESKPLVREFVHKLYREHPEQMKRLARSDRGDPSAYPGFDAFFDSLDTRLDKDGVRFLMRLHTRRKLGDDLGRELVGDVVDDLQLQEALAELLGDALPTIEDLAFVAPAIEARRAAKAKKEAEAAAQSPAGK